MSVNGTGLNYKDDGTIYIENYEELISQLLKSVTLVHCYENNFYYRYNEKTGVFQELDETRQKKIVLRYLQSIGKGIWTPALEKNILATFPSFVKGVPKMNIRKNILTLDNGVLDLSTMTLESWSEKNRSTFRLPVKYDKTAECPVYDKFIEDVSVGDKILMNTLNEIVGYILSDSIEAGKLIALTGSGANGKSTFLKVVQSMLAEENISSISLSELNAKPFSRHFIADKKINIIYENDTKMTLSGMFSGITKSIVTGDAVNGEIKGGKNYSFTPNLKIVLAANTLPKIDEIPDTAVLRRYLVLPFRACFLSNADKGIFSKMQKERKGILLRGLEGLLRLQDNNYRFSYEKKSQKYIEEQVSQAFPICKFVNDYIKADKDSKITYNEIHNIYLMWAKRNGIDSLLSGKAFAEQVKRSLDKNYISYEMFKSGGSRGLKGIAIRK